MIKPIINYLKSKQRNRKTLLIQNLILVTVVFYLFLLSALKTVAIAQLVRASDCGSEGRGFEPHWLPIFKKLSFIESFFINTIHQKPLLKAFEGKKRADFALFLPK